jgi:hypothetical protein
MRQQRIIQEQEFLNAVEPAGGADDEIRHEPRPSEPESSDMNGACIGPWTGDRNNEEFEESSPWAKKTILCLGKVF